MRTKTKLEATLPKPCAAPVSEPKRSRSKPKPASAVRLKPEPPAAPGWRELMMLSVGGDGSQCVWKAPSKTFRPGGEWVRASVSR